ncbi:CobW family GTP-binding protein [Paenibacillus sp. 481]|uniref:CobW family GTP-binding protein n=1 Tax=Paenibacillus sp. 481 TaxID=2835869 RepID=UPI001E34A5B9|nr:CobW family GTP-binding protein [Paenibacillus sp. 481]UHA73050.1 GTP-binding protein [Paenibacillus sp. 481]
MDQLEAKPIPIIILSGFLGSGKTTLLQRWVQESFARGWKPAVVMNEVGDVNLDGQLLPSEVAMTEMLSGCICCTIRGDFGVKLYELANEERPDIIFVECTGIAEPMELVDSITEVSIYSPLRLSAIVTIGDAKHLSDLLHSSEAGVKPTKITRLLKEQVRAANMVVLNKADLVSAEQLNAVKQWLLDWNGTAQIAVAQRAEVDNTLFEWCASAYEVRQDAVYEASASPTSPTSSTAETHAACGCHDVTCEHDSTYEYDAACDHGAVGQSDTERGDSVRGEMARAHHHVTVWTYPLSGPVHSEKFEQWLHELPQQAYRAKGIVTFTDVTKRYMFQFAYRATEFIPITPQGVVQDVVVVIGEQLDAVHLQRSLQTLIEQP